MTQLYWQTTGSGDRDLVLLHGWGLNAEVWSCIRERLGAHFRLHLVDLPGYGRSENFPAMTLEEMAECLLPFMPSQTLVLGWSLGGLVASQLALRAPQRVTGLITVASSPCFSATEAWPGIKPDTLTQFQQQLSEDFKRTVERFLALQTLGTDTAREDARTLKNVVLRLPMPPVDVLERGTGNFAHCRSARGDANAAAAVAAHLRLSGRSGATGDCTLAGCTVAKQRVSDHGKSSACAIYFSS